MNGVITIDENNISIENFEEPEAAKTPGDIESRDALIAKLGCSGQQRSTDETKIITFPRATAQQQSILRTLFPATSKFQEFNLGPIPLRVLELAEIAIEQGLELEIWHEKIPTIDPVLVGYTRDPRYSWMTEYRLIARWGSALDEWPALIKKHSDYLVAKLHGIQADIKAMIEKVNSGDMDDFYNGNRVNPHLSITSSS